MCRFIVPAFNHYACEPSATLGYRACCPSSTMRWSRAPQTPTITAERFHSSAPVERGYRAVSTHSASASKAPFQALFARVIRSACCERATVVVVQHNCLCLGFRPREKDLEKKTGFHKSVGLCGRGDGLGRCGFVSHVRNLGCQQGCAFVWSKSMADDEDSLIHSCARDCLLR